MWKELLPIIVILGLGWLALNLMNSGTRPPENTAEIEFICDDRLIKYTTDGDVWMTVLIRNDYRSYAPEC